MPEFLHQFSRSKMERKLPLLKKSFGKVFKMNKKCAEETKLPMCHQSLQMELTVPSPSHSHWMDRWTVHKKEVGKRRRLAKKIKDKS
jgi:hypothetical protein